MITSAPSAGMLCKLIFCTAAPEKWRSGELCYHLDEIGSFKIDSPSSLSSPSVRRSSGLKLRTSYQPLQATLPAMSRPPTLRAASIRSPNRFAGRLFMSNFPRRTEGWDQQRQNDEMRSPRSRGLELRRSSPALRQQTGHVVALCCKFRHLFIRDCCSG